MFIGKNDHCLCQRGQFYLAVLVAVVLLMPSIGRTAAADTLFPYQPLGIDFNIVLQPQPIPIRLLTIGHQFTAAEDDAGNTALVATIIDEKYGTGIHSQRCYQNTALQAYLRRNFPERENGKPCSYSLLDKVCQLQRETILSHNNYSPLPAPITETIASFLPGYRSFCKRVTPDMLVFFRGLRCESPLLTDHSQKRWTFVLRWLVYKKVIEWRYPRKTFIEWLEEESQKPDKIDKGSNALVAALIAPPRQLPPTMNEENFHRRKIQSLPCDVKEVILQFLEGYRPYRQRIRLTHILNQTRNPFNQYVSQWSISRFKPISFDPTSITYELPSFRIVLDIHPVEHMMRRLLEPTSMQIYRMHDFTWQRNRYFMEREEFRQEHHGSIAGFPSFERWCVFRGLPDSRRYSM